MSIALAVAALRQGGRGIALDMLPYAKFLGVHADRDGDEVALYMPFHDRLIGSPGRLHGGSVAGLLELAATVRLLAALAEDDPLPGLKPLTITVNYLREGQLQGTHAQATLTRLGRRVANLHATAWQDEPDRPIASATLNIVLDRG